MNTVFENFEIPISKGLEAYINSSLIHLGLDTYRGIQLNLPYHSQSLRRIQSIEFKVVGRPISF